MAVAADLASLVSEVDMREFRDRLAALKELRSAWSTTLGPAATQQERPVIQERVSFVTALLEHAMVSQI